MKINLFEEKIESRFFTLIKNIKTKSNSFYDSYLDLLEETLKYILSANNVLYDNTKTSGQILKNEMVIEFMNNELFIDDYTYSKLFDYIKKCNDHKHKKEKQLSIDSVINYLKVYFDFVNYYKVYKNEEPLTFNPSYFNDIFNDIEEKNDLIIDKLEKQEQEIKRISNKLDSLGPSGEEKKNIFISKLVKSKKYYVWFGREKIFAKERNNTIKYLFITICFGVVSTILTSLASKIYTTFTFFENMWLGALIFILIYTFTYSKKILADDYVNKTIYINSYINAVKFPLVRHKEKNKYLVFRILSYISVFLNIFMIFEYYSGTVDIFALIFEILYFVFSIISIIKYKSLVEGYFIFGILENCSDFKYVLDISKNKLIPYDELKEFEKNNIEK